MPADGGEAAGPVTTRTVDRGDCTANGDASAGSVDSADPTTTVLGSRVAVARPHSRETAETTDAT